ncbi:cupin domain-containing protein [Chamaesiphon sp.]|uniref:cupin domain-containing protein n=1 Tax=Chamaesiphon sp. TaxID=2814140 RepID=UPI003592FD94
MPSTPLSTAIINLIDRLQLQPHPEGGFYRETWRSDLALPQAILPPDYTGDRAAGTAILFLLPTGYRSRWHRVRSAELWFHQAGDPLELVIAKTLDAGSPAVIYLGRDDCWQAVVPPNYWQQAQPVASESLAGYALVACVVVPGFDFADFEMSAA